MNTFLRLNRGMLRQPLNIRIWLMLLVGVNFVAPLFFLGRIEATLTLAAFFAGFAIMMIVTATTGYTRLLGIAHILWYPLIGFLWTRLDGTVARDPFDVWLRLLMLLNAVSLVIDTVDVVRYMAGDREETVAGL